MKNYNHIKRTIQILILVFSVSLTYANLNVITVTKKITENVSFNSKEKEVIYSSGMKTTDEVSRVFLFNGEKVTVYVGLDSNHNVSLISLSKDVSKENFDSVKRVLIASNGCWDRCVTVRRCSDKPTTAGVIGCYAECTFKCIGESLQESEALNNKL